jgi:hypothetical protein
MSNHNHPVLFLGLVLPVALSVVSVLRFSVTARRRSRTRFAAGSVRRLPSNVIDPRSLL